MKKIYITILLILLTVAFTSAQQPFVNVKGHVINKETGAPVAGQTMFVMLDSLYSAYYNKTVTDESGFYSFSVPFMYDTTKVSFTVYTYDCNGTIVSGTGKYFPITIDFSICGNSQSECDAMFKYLPTADNTLTYEFFNGSSTIPGATPNYLWDFGDGITSSEQNPVHSYSKPGLYNVCLSIRSSDSSCNSIFCIPVQAGITPPGPCESSFWYYNDSTGNQYVFNGSLLNGQADTWTWDFGDGTTTAGQMVSHTFASSKATYTVCLTTTGINPDGTPCTSKSCQEVYVYVPDPCESYFWYYPDSSGTGYTFEGYAKNISINSWAWDFGDGATGKGQFVSHSFKGQNDIFKVCLTTTGTSADGTTCTYSYCQDVYYSFPSPCENSFWYQSDSSASSYTFQGWTKNNQTSSWSWDFGDGTTATGQTVSHSYPDTNAVYTVCLTTTGINFDGTTCTFSSCQDVNIYKPSPCESSFWYYSESSAPGFIFEGYTMNNNIDTWTWDFGDGITASGQKVLHTFNDFKTTHNVCLTTTGTGADGESCTFSSCIEVYNYIPSPCENYFKATTNDGLTYSFSGNLNSGNPAIYYWDFGDGYTGTGQLAEHTFRSNFAELFYNVCLTTITTDPAVNDTCRSTSCQVIYPGSYDTTCQANITAFPDPTGFTFRFENITSRVGIMNFWDFGDGSKSAETSPVHTYSSPGLYMACLTVLDSLNKCKSYACLEIWVNMIEPGCKASFYALPVDSVNSDGSALNYKFVNSSAQGFTNQEWSFGDGTASYDANPVHTYAASGIYNACLTIWDSSGICKSNFCMDIYAGKVIGDNAFSGIVLAGNTVADQGIVWLISPDNNYNSETFIEPGGIYRFTGVPYGKYYIYAMLTPGSPLFFNYLPTYYKSSINWQEATLISTGEPNAWYPIMLISSTNNYQGDAIINGSIHWTDASGAPMSPATNVEIVLYNTAGEPVAYTFSESDGSYQFNNLPYGEYTIQAEMQGKDTQRTPVILTENSTNVSIDFMVNESAIYFLGIDALNKTKIQAGNIYPNPVTDNLNLELNIPVSGTATVEVIDMQGRIIHRELTELANGNSRISIKTGDFVKGVYQLRIKTAGQKPVQRRFIK